MSGSASPSPGASPQRIPTLFLVVFSLVWCGGTVWFDFSIASGLWKQARTTSFPVASATVIESRVAVQQGKHGSSYHPRVRYTYTVAGRAYTGERYAFANDSGPGESWAESVVAAYPAGSVTSVAYDPSDPARAVLRVGLRADDFMPAMFMLPFNIVVLTIAAVWRRRVPWLRRGPPVGRVLCADGQRVVVSLAVWRPIWSALAGCAVAVVPFVPVNGFFFNMHASGVVMGGELGVILGAGMAAWVFARRRARRRGPWLEIDFGRGMAIFPELDGQRETVPLAHISGVAVQDDLWISAEKTDGALAPIMNASSPLFDGEAAAAWLAGLLRPARRA